MRQHLRRFGTQQYAGKPSAPVRGHEDEIALLFARRGDDLFVGQATGGDDNFTAHARRFGPFCHLLDDPLPAQPRLREEALATLHATRAREVIGTRPEFVYYVQGRDPCLDVLGEFDAALDASIGKGRTVRRQENMLEHHTFASIAVPGCSKRATRPMRKWLVLNRAT